MECQNSEVAVDTLVTLELDYVLSTMKLNKTAKLLNIMVSGEYDAFTHKLLRAKTGCFGQARYMQNHLCYLHDFTNISFRWQSFDAVFLFGSLARERDVDFTFLFNKLVSITNENSYIIFFENSDNLNVSPDSDSIQRKVMQYSTFPKNVLIRDSFVEGLKSKITICRKVTFGE